MTLTGAQLSEEISNEQPGRQHSTDRIIESGRGARVDAHGRT